MSKKTNRLLAGFLIIAVAVVAIFGAFPATGGSASGGGSNGLMKKAFARAGGGEDFGGGGYDSGGSDFGGSDWDSGTPIFGGTSSGGSGGGVAGLVVCVVIVIVVVVFVSIARKKGMAPGGMGGPLKGIPGSVTMPPMPSIPGKDIQTDIEERKGKLVESDPDWNEDRFLDVAETIFFTVQEGWTKKELNICRPYLSNSVYNRFKKQLEDLTKRGLRNVCENIVVGSTEIVKIEQDKQFDSVTVKFRASMRDYKVNEKTGQLVEGSTAQTPPFTEFWTFVRKAGLKTKEAHAVESKKCPNCGAPLEINESGVCKYCKANVVSGNFDWVLSKITQRDEWHV